MSAAIVLASPPHRPYIWVNSDCPGPGGVVSDTGLQKLAFFLLLALILYVSVTGGA